MATATLPNWYARRANVVEQEVLLTDASEVNALASDPYTARCLISHCNGLVCGLPRRDLQVVFRAFASQQQFLARQSSGSANKTERFALQSAGTLTKCHLVLEAIGLILLGEHLNRATVIEGNHHGEQKRPTTKAQRRVSNLHLKLRKPRQAPCP
jgi:hypothetical protein